MSALRITSVAINAMGGHGGGVLADWIAQTAEAEGYYAQVTSVPGFAQRSGATIYYVEIFPRTSQEPAPVFALMAVPGDVDVVVASELAEAGRAVLRGLVTPQRTALIASTHREHTTEEKLSRFDGRRDSSVVFERCEAAARSLVAFDMRIAAEQCGCLISAVLLGAIAGSGALPFPRRAFEDMIRRGKIAVDANLRGFTLGFDRAAAGTREVPQARASLQITAASLAAANASPGKWEAEIRERFPGAAADVVRLGVDRLIDYQDERYARLYMDRAARVLAADSADQGYRLTVEVARNLALRMAHEDVIRVADIKTRARRFADVARENRLGDDSFWDVTEFLAPRPEDIFDLMPARLGRALSRSRTANRVFARALSGGFTIRTSRLRGFLMLFTMARLRPLRRFSLGQARQVDLIEDWLERVVAVSGDYALALETAMLLTLVRGYGATFERGRASYQQILSVLDGLAGRADAAQRLAGLREAALADEDGALLSRSIAALRPVSRAA